MTNPIVVTSAQYWGILWMVFNIGWFHAASVIFAKPHKEVQDDSDY